MIEIYDADTLELISQNLKESLYPNTGRKMIYTPHAKERLSDPNRFGNIAGTRELMQIMSKIISKGMSKIYKEHNDESNIYVVTSKSTGYGAVINWRPDNQATKNKDMNHAVIVTVLGSKDKHFTKYKNDIKILVEKQLENLYFELSGHKLQEISEEGCLDWIELKTEKDHEGRFGNLTIVMYEGKYYDCNATFIEID